MTAGDARYDSLQVKAETKSTRHGLYLLLGYTYARNFDSGFNDGLGSSTGATYFPLPGTIASGLESVASPTQSQFHRQRAVRPALWERQAVWRGWSRPVNAVLGNWQSQRDRKNHIGVPHLYHQQQQRFGGTPDQQREQLITS